MASRFLPSARTRTPIVDIPASPPREVLDAIDAAFAACERLEAAGRHVRFTMDAASGRLRAELTDGDGMRLHGLSGREVLDLAAGATLD